LRTTNDERRRTKRESYDLRPPIDRMPNAIECLRDEATLIIAASEVDSNLYWASGFLANDPHIYIEFRGEKILLSSGLELGRARKEARVDRVVSTAPYEERIRSTGATPKLVDLAALFLQETGALRLRVPWNFPLGYAEDLRKKGLAVEPRADPFYPGRLTKRPDEIAAIAAAQEVAEGAVALAVDRIACSRIDGDRLLLGDEVLTSEGLRKEIRRFLLDRGYEAPGIIIAGGDQACDPHLRGSGPLPPHRPIVIDIFPRSHETRYWGDTTRTVVRGRATPEVAGLFRDVLDAQALAISLVRDGAEGSEIHEKVHEHFRSRGRETREAGGRMEGFVHGTGHGIGLDIHEGPRISRAASILPAGAVVSVEPGLYYPGIGGVRIEDVVVVEPAGARNLGKYPKVLAV
jgi:Xaa-Pro aminopeptidase